MPRKILISTSGTPGVTRYRFTAAAESAGWDYDIAPFPKNLDETPNLGVSKFIQWAKIHMQDYDQIWTNNYSNAFGAFIGMSREAWGHQIIADVDDHFENVPVGNLVHEAWYGQRRRKYLALIEEADLVRCSTPFLADRYNGVLAPNFVNLDEWAGPVRKKKSAAEVVIACPAGLGRAGDYAEIREPLKAALELPNVKVLFFGDLPSWANDYPAGKVVYCSWVPFELYPKMMNYLSPDIIVSPMLHNDFNLAKSNLKWLESGAVDACFMGERWGEYQRTVLDGVTGVLADGESDWTQKLLWLCTEHDERRKIAAEGAKEVAKNWTWDAVRPAWEQGVLGNGANDDRVACSTG